MDYNGISFEDFKNKVCTYNKKDWDTVNKAFNYALKYHSGQFRESGEEYISHPLNVAYILAKMHADTNTLCAALLHDLVEDTSVSIDDITKEFNSTVSLLVDGVTKISKMEFDNRENFVAFNIRRIIVSIKEDARIIIIKLADRLHNMRTLSYKNKDRQKEIALETVEIYVPLAYYIGSYSIKDELENISFSYLKPETYKELSHKLSFIRNENRKMLVRMQNEIKARLNQEGIKCHIDLRFKDTYSVYKKMITNSDIVNIHDLLGIKVVVKNIKDCYIALMCVHSLYPPFTYKFKDYIVKPKTNMYRSLHTTVYSDNGKLVQVQIRTKEMDKIATYGLTSYWFNDRVKAYINMKNDLENKFQFFKSLKELDSTISDNIEFVNQIKKELFSSNVYVRSDIGEIIELPVDSTPIDFAYKIHTDVGNSMIAAIVNDTSVPFDYKLKNNDRVRIIVDESVYVDKSEWLDIVVTTNAKRKIIDYIKDHDKNN